MSRNLRHKQSSPIQAQKSIKRPLASDNSSDDDYAGVDLISASEEDEPDVEVAEEQAIIESEEDDDNDAVLQPYNDDDQSSWVGFDLDNEPTFGSSDPLIDDNLTRTSTPNLYAEATSWETSSARRVRFDLSDSDSSDTEIDIFPDIFLDQNSLDPRFRQTIENDYNNDNDDPPSDEGSYWDFRGDEAEVAADAEVEEDEESDESSGSSGYETDEGETTEEDLPPAARYIPARSVLRHQSAESSSAEEDVTVVRRTPYRHSPRNGPRLGSWVTDANKPFAVIDSRGKRMMMFKARNTRRFSFDTVPSQPAQNLLEPPLAFSPMLGSGTTTMLMHALFPPLNQFFGSQAIGPPEAFYPFVSVAANGVITQDDPSSSFEEDDMDDDDLWNIRDLIDFGDETSAEEGEDEDLVEVEESSTSPAEPFRPTTASSEDQVHPLLNHLDRGVVGAFRSNQSRHQLLMRNAASRESLAFSGPSYRQGTLRGIKGGRLAAAYTPITPLRKSKNVKANMTLSSPSPIAEAVADGKRKFAGDQHASHGQSRCHKRSRSMF